MKICAVMDDLHDAKIGGAERSTLLALSRMVELGHAVEVVTAGPNWSETTASRLSDAWPALRFQGHRVEAVGMFHDFALTRRPRTARILANLIDGVAPELVQFHVIHNYCSWDVVRCSVGKGRVLVPTLHDLAPLCKGVLRCTPSEALQSGDVQLRSLGACWRCQKHTFDPTKRYRVLRILNECADGVVFVSKWLRDFYLANGLRSEVRVIYNGVEADWTQMPLTEALRILQPRSLVNRDAWHVIAGGRMKPIKGFMSLIDAVASLPQVVSGKRIGLTVYGERNSHYEALAAFARAKGLADRCYFPGPLSADEVRALASVADVGVVPSTYPDPLPRTALEYVAIGLPCVLPSIGGSGEIARTVPEIAPYVRCVDASHVPSLAGAILGLLRVPSERARCPVGLAQSNFDLRVGVERRLEFYEGLLMRGRRRRAGRRA